MPRKKRQPVIDQLRDWAVQRIRKIAWAAGIVATISGGIVGYAKAWPEIEPWWWASRGFVYSQVDSARSQFKQAQDSTAAILRDLQIEQAEGKRDAAKEAKAKWGVELNKTADPITREMIDRHINELEASVGKLDSQIRTLNRMRALER